MSSIRRRPRRRCRRITWGYRFRWSRRVGKGAKRRAHHLSPNSPRDGGHASLCPPYGGGTLFARTLPQPQLLIPLRGDLVAPGAICRRAAAVAGDDAGLLSLDVGVDAGHPGIDFVG